MVEQTNMGKRHGDTVFIASIDNMVVTNAASCLHNIFHSALMGTLYIVAKGEESVGTDRKSTRLNSSHANISYAVFCLKKKKNTQKSTESSRLVRHGTSGACSEERI